MTAEIKNREAAGNLKKAGWPIFINWQDISVNF
jgi:hypothetical protein